ncbi:MAG: MFS transporter [Prevotella sp.]|nr:MFS transporter [Prevotella sp.]MCM1075228.1 MFS transporter [Ruminococcus sp.]
MKGIKLKLAIMNFLEFAVWGSYLTCLGNYLGSHGLGLDIALFYTVQGIVSIFMPAIMGVIADKYVQPQKLLGYCHFLAAVFMLGAWHYGMTHPTLDFWPFFTLYTLSVAFFMPTIALANTVAFSSLKKAGLDTVKDFPPIRVLGTIGFIAAMWFVNCFYVADGSVGFSLSNPLGIGQDDPRFQYTVNQLLTCSVFGLLLFLYCMTLPKCAIAGKEQPSKGIVSILGLDAFKLFKRKKMAIFFIFSMLLGVSLQITNGYANPFITSFKAIPEYMNSFGANNATLLTSLSQMSEALCILLIPFCLRRFGIKRVMMIAMVAWVFRFGCFGVGNPGSGVWLFIISMLVYGVAFDFFNVSGALFVEKETDPKIQASAQGLFMLMTNGIGATFGTLAAGAVVNSYCTWSPTTPSYLLGDWETVWLIFASYALVVFVLFTMIFKYKHEPERIKLNQVSAQGSGDPEGMVD